MALPASLAFCRFGSPTARATLELYLDIVCPFSLKQIRGLKAHVLPVVEKQPDALQVVVRHVPQPWHSSSTFVHEAAIAVGKLGGHEAYAPFLFELFEKQAEFFDEPCANETPVNTRKRLAKIAGKYVDEHKFLEAITTGKGNDGNAVSADLKLAVRFARQNSVHVTPTAATNGIVDPSISSSFGADDWAKYMQEKAGVKA